MTTSRAFKQYKFPLIPNWVASHAEQEIDNNSNSIIQLPQAMLFFSFWMIEMFMLYHSEYNVEGAVFCKTYKETEGDELYRLDNTYDDLDDDDDDDFDDEAEGVDSDDLQRC
jgi:hypothetical protein